MLIDELLQVQTVARGTRALKVEPWVLLLMESLLLAWEIPRTIPTIFLFLFMVSWLGIFILSVYKLFELVCSILSETYYELWAKTEINVHNVFTDR